MNLCISIGVQSAPGTETPKKARRPACLSLAHLLLLLLVRTQPGDCGEPLPSASPVTSVRTIPTTTQTMPSVNASCAFPGCDLTFDNGTSSSSVETTTHVVIATTLNQVQRSKGDVSTVTSVWVNSASNNSDSSSLKGNSSSGPFSGNPPPLGEVPPKESTASSDRPEQPTTETTESGTGRTVIQERATTQPPSDVATKTGKPPRRKFRKGQRRNGGDRRNASLSSAWREETRFLWEPRDPVPVPGYAFGLAFGAVALAGLVGVGTACGGSAKPMLGTSWATAVTAIVVASAASRAAALLLLPEPLLRRLLQAASPAGLFLALALFWLALCRPALSRLVVAGACFVVLLVLPLVAESQAGTLFDARMLLVARLASLAAACLAILAALVAFPWLRRVALRSQDALLCSALAKMQDDAAEVPRRLPRPMARTTLRAALAATLLGLALTLLLGHAALHAGQAAHPRWLWWTCRGLTLLAELCADACLAFAASRPAARCHAPVPTTATLLTPPGFASDSFGRPGGHRCGAIGSRGDPSEAAALCDSQSPAKTGLLGQATLQRTALLFHDQCVSSSVSTSRFCSAAGGSRDGTSSDEDGDDASHRALAGSTAPGTVDGSPWSQAHSSASFRRLGSSTCSSESAAHSFDLAWGGGLRPPQSLRLDLSTGHHHRRGVGAGDASEDVTPDSAVYVDLSPELRRSEGHSLDKLQSKGCPCCAARRPWRRTALQRYTLSASRFSLSGYEPLRRDDDCRCCAADHATVDPLRQMKTCAVAKEEWHRNLQSLPPPASSAF
ncbi:uncharacterized protein LOC119372526 [Rhipicephalus sanguineus]|uniref:uncharacterized protein LOC119372526 n=1 Tax=Rhipicephalus sanguineus TaxID=34632 RepID=UPI001894693A|nr:uncharacterized protein LOC119372526 [Rhipicephalus sanguineus]